TVIGVGVKNSTSDLLISNCDEFIYYDDLARDGPASRKDNKPVRRAPAAKAPNPKDRKQEAIDLVLETTTALASERGDTAKLWGSMIKQTLKRRHPGFNESFYGFPSFNELLEEAQTRGYLKLELDEKSGGYVIQSVTP
ncbi:MAG: hypothetical protein ACXWJU_06075, partial [Hyphomicrobium sp.]